ncbi:MAG: GTPase [Alphaproteobacteria bacterium]|nr:GTPase [Alphaproteobacteria bacterium]
MRLKSFHGATLTDAMRGVREALGENAIIVATREDETGGVRVTAAIDDPQTPVGETRPLAQPQSGSEALEKIAEAITRHQVPSHLAEKLMASATQFAGDDPILTLGAAIDTHFKFDPITAPLSGDKTGYHPLLLVGPCGAGKTLCTAKFATQATLAKYKATVISTDLERAGGMEQLAAFTRLLKLNLVEIEDWHALRDIVSMQKGNPVFIDTAGHNPFNAVEREATREFISAVGTATLVLQAGLDAAEAIDVAYEYRGLGATRLLVTRLDTVRRIGSLLRLAYECRMPLCNYSASAKVTEPPQPLNPVALARLILKIPGSSAAVEEEAEARRAVI